MSDDVEVFAIWTAWGDYIDKYPIVFLSMLTDKYSEEFFNKNLVPLANQALIALAKIENFDLQGQSLVDYEDTKSLLGLYK